MPRFENPVKPLRNRELTIGVGMLLAMLVVNVAVAYRAVAQMHAAATAVADANKVLDSLDQLFSTLQDAETGQRGYIITGNEQYLEPYETARTIIDKHIEQVEKVSLGDADRREHLETIRPLIALKLRELSATIELRKTSFEAAQTRVLSNRGKQAMDSIRVVMKVMRDHEHQVLVDREGAMTDGYRSTQLAIGLAAAIGAVSLAGFLVILLRYLNARERATATMHEQRELLRATLGSIGDAMISTDRDTRVTFLNTVAQHLTGWTQDDARGQPLESVFRIVNEHTRQTVENPALRAIREGAIVGLANHTILISKNGSERAIDDSAAPIRTAKGEVAGAVLVFRDVTERREAEEAMRLIEARQAAILRASSDAIITIDVGGAVVAMNPAAEKIFGYSRQEAIGQKLETLIVPESLQSSHRGGLKRLQVTGEAKVLNQRLEMPAVRKDGSQIMVELFIHQLEGSNPPQYTGFVKDITRQKEAEHALGERMKLLTLGSEIGRALTENKPLDEMLKQCASAIVTHLDGAFARIWILDAPDQVLVLRASSGLYEHIDGAHGRVPVGQFKIGRIAQNRTPHLTNNVVGDPEVPEQDWAEREGMTSFVGYPLIVDDEVIGVMAMFARHTLSAYTMAAIASVADQIALGIDRKHAEETLANLLARESERSRRLQQLGAASLTLNSATNTSSVLGVVNAEAKQLLGVSHSNVIFEGQATTPSENGLVAPLIGRSGRLLGYIHLHGKRNGDFTEDDEAILKQLAHMAAVAFDNARLYEELREGDLKKDEFLAMLAHELRNPLAPIRNSLKIMRMAGQDPSTLETNRVMIERQVQQMVRLVDDLLDLSRITRGKMQIHKSRVDLSAILASAIESSRPLIDQLHHELIVNQPSDPILVDADSVRMSQVFVNLLNNAAKYTEPGGKITVSVKRESESVAVHVRDTGVGISTEMLSRVFDMFTQADQSLERSQGGLGIGLTLVRRLVEMHDGSVEAFSDGAGKGCEFIVHMPVIGQTVEIKPVVGTSESEHPQARKKGRVLVVDDNRDSADSLAMLLRLEGSEVRIAYDGIEAVDAAKNFEPAVILLDIGLPRLNGYEAARRIRENAAAGGQPILIALTGWGQDEDKRRSKEAGFDHHMVKPVDPDVLAKLLNSLSS